MMQQRILIIDDNAENLELMRYILEHSGCKCLTAMDGAVGVRMSKQEKPDLIICDIQLPTLSGFEIIQQLKSDKEFKNIPVIAVSAYTMIGDKEKILSAGFNGYISKPIEATTFANQIKSFIRGC